MQLKNLINLIKRKSGMDDFDIAEFIGCKLSVVQQMQREATPNHANKDVVRLKRLLRIVTKQRLSGDFPLEYFRKIDNESEY